MRTDVRIIVRIKGALKIGRMDQYCDRRRNPNPCDPHSDAARYRSTDLPTIHGAPRERMKEDEAMTDWREGIMRILNQINDEWMLHRIYNFLVRFYYLGED